MARAPAKNPALGGGFYVYEHWRSDTSQCFYVGKGTGRRAHKFNCRTKHHRHIGALLRSLGGDIEIRFVATDLDEPAALTLECERIAHWRSLGVPLVNLTDGGEGASGYVAPPETRAKVSKASRAYWSKPEARAAASERLRADPPARRPGVAEKLSVNNAMNSAENRAKVAAAKREYWARPGARDAMKGENSVAHRPDVKAKASARMKALWADPEYRASRSGDNNPSRRPEVAAKRIGDRNSSKRPEFSAAIKAHWAQPEARAKHQAAMKEAWKRRRADAIDAVGA